MLIWAWLGKAHKAQLALHLKGQASHVGGDKGLRDQLRGVPVPSEQVAPGSGVCGPST
jgi:hypothetical protein